MIGRHRGRGAALVLALAGLFVSSQAALAETVIQACSGVCGSYEIVDESSPRRGANCLYETGSGDLDRITIRAPQNVHSAWTAPPKQWVGWRFIIQRDAPPIDDQYTTIHRSSIVKQKVDENVDPSQFTRRSWIEPTEDPSGRYRVRIVILWYAQGSQTQVSGRAKIEYDWYKQKWNGTFDTDSEYCNFEYD